MMNLNEISELLKETGVFSLLPDADLEKFVSHVELLQYPLGRAVCRGGDEIDAFYLVYAGRARVVSKQADADEVTVGTLARGQFFGLQGLMGETRHEYTVRAASDLALLRLTRQDFWKLLDQYPYLRGYFEQYATETSLLYFIERCAVFAPLSPQQVRELLGCLHEQEFAADQTIYRKGDPADAFYLVHRGSVRIVQEELHGKVMRLLKPGESFGPMGLLTGQPRATTAVAGEASSVFRLDKKDFDQLINTNPAFREMFISTMAGFEQVSGGRAAQMPGNSYTGSLVMPGSAPVKTTGPLLAPAGVQIMPDGLLQLPEAPPDLTAEKNGYYPKRSRRYPALLQLSETDCGAACLAMILRYYGKQVSINRLRDLANVSRDGATLYSVAEAAEQLGFTTRGIRASWDYLSKVETPAIAHWEGFHYIVLYKATPDHVIVADPAIGLRKLTAEEFQKGWTGYLLLFQPTPKLENVEESKTTFGRFLPLLKPYRKLLLEIFAASILLQVFGLATPIFTQVVVDKALVLKSGSLLNLMLIGMMLITIFQTGTNVIRYYLLVHTTRRIDLQMMVDFYRHVLSLPLRYFEERKVGDIIKRFNENARIRNFLTSRATGVILDSLVLVVYLVLMAFYNLKLTFIALLFMPAYVVLSLVMTPKLVRQQREAFEKEAQADSQMVESITGIGTVKATAAERRVRWKLEGVMVQALNVQFRNAILNITTLSVSNVLQTLNSLVLFWFGAQLVIEGQLSIGQLVAFNLLVGNVTRPILSVFELWNEFQGINVALERLNEVFDTKPEEDPSNPNLTHLPAARGHIRFESVTFRYPTRGDRNALQNVTLEILPGQTVALVGRSGAGKSTFASLLLRMHQPNEGRILIDGYDLTQLSISSLRSQIGVVPQEVFLFSGTIRENIAFGDPDARLEEVVGAAMLAGAHEFISELPLGYETIIGERGQSLSGGQKQRIAIARALFTKPRILIFDEATSALDTESERAIQQNLDSILKNRTTLIIAHRLSTVRNADLIIVMDRGTVLETGTHDELMEQKGMYYYLNSQQLEG
jgi:ATP-binding cassette, subfamily B, bacterial HlyB/CyaB